MLTTWRRYGGATTVTPMVGRRAVAIAFVALLTSCADPTSQPGGDDAGQPSTHAGMEALQIVRLAADPETGCVGVVGDHMPADTVPDCSRTTHEWPNSIEFRADPPRMVNADTGDVLAQEGDVLHLTGGTGEPGVFHVQVVDVVSSGDP